MLKELLKELIPVGIGELVKAIKRGKARRKAKRELKDLRLKKELSRERRMAKNGN